MKNNFKIIGVTGGVGAGKSTILKYIQSNYNCELFVTDIIAYEIMRNDEDCLSAIKTAFAEDDIFGANGEINSIKVGKVIFKNDEKRKIMNSIVHPRVIKYVKDGCKQAKKEGKVDFVVVESALLIECGMTSFCDEVWYITAPINTRIERLKASRGYSKQKCLDIIQGQLSEDEFIKNSTSVINTGCKPTETFKQVDTTFATIGIKKKENAANSLLDAVAGNLE